MSKLNMAQLQEQLLAMQAKIAELESEKARKADRTFIEIYENPGHGGVDAYGYLDLDKLPEGTTRVRIALWKGNRVNRRGENCLYHGEAEPAVPKDADTKAA